MEWYVKRRIGDLADDAERQFGSREGLVFQDKRYSFAEVAGEVDRAAKGLMAQGIKRGDHVALWLNNCADWIFISFGLAKIGAVQVPINTRFRTADLEYVVRQSDSTVLITHDTSGPIDYLAMVREVVSLPKTASLIEDANFPELRQVIIVDDQEHEGTTSWNKCLNDGVTITDGTLAARA
ncbi:MAG: AMP-binding protein, partial [Rhodospirillaceae bacterium]|nr:AMP-binding protein [Rhodospirillaceae bacterium]